MDKKFYFIRGDKGLEDELPVNQFNYLCDVDIITTSKKEALRLIKELTEDFNEKFNTNYKSDYLFTLELVYFNENGERVEYWNKWHIH